MRPRQVLSAAFTRLRPSTELKHPALVAPLCVGVATLARLLLDPVLKDHGPYLFFAIAVVVAALYGGSLAGIAAVLLSLPLCDYLFIEPRYTWFIYDARGDSLMLFLFAWSLCFLGAYLVAQELGLGRIGAGGGGIAFAYTPYRMT